MILDMMGSLSLSLVGLRFLLFRTRLLVQQHLAAIGAGKEDGERLLFLSCGYNRIIWW